MRRKSITICLTLLLAGCTGLDAQIWRLEKFIAFNQIGSGKDVWLIKHNAFGIYEKVILVFGFIDDRSACEQIVEHYRTRFPQERYLCSFAN